MSGRPVWLASASLVSKGRLVPSSKWSADPRTLASLERHLQRALTGVGDADVGGRFFRMPITACMHRALSDEELDGLPVDWKRRPPRDLAGGGVETYWKIGMAAGLTSTDPCERPGRTPIPGYLLSSDVYLLVECGKCVSCRARGRVEEQVTSECRPRGGCVG